MKFNNNQYDILKKIALYVLPALATLILGLGQIWHLNYSQEISQTIALIVTFIDTVLGGILGVSSANYWKNVEKADVLDPKEEGVD